MHVHRHRGSRSSSPKTSRRLLGWLNPLAKPQTLKPKPKHQPDPGVQAAMAQLMRSLTPQQQQQISSLAPQQQKALLQRIMALQHQTQQAGPQQQHPQHPQQHQQQQQQGGPQFGQQIKYEAAQGGSVKFEPGHGAQLKRESGQLSGQVRRQRLAEDCCIITSASSAGRKQRWRGRILHQRVHAIWCSHVWGQPRPCR